MPLPQLAVTLSKFEQIEILRAEIEQRQGEVQATERQIKEVLYEVERQRYLQTVHPIFHQLQPPPKLAELPQLTANREALHEAVQHMQAALAALEAETAGQTAPARPAMGLRPAAAPGAPAAPAAPAAPRRAKFEF